MLKGQQAMSFSSDMLFERYLLQNNLFDDSKTLLHSYSASDNLTNLQKDSVNYYLGKTYYKLDISDSAKSYFGKVNNESSLFTESVILKSFISLSYDDTCKVQNDLNSIQTNDKQLQEFILFTKASAYLLQRDTISFSKCKNSFTNNYPALIESEKKLISIKNNLPNYHKSGFLAGTLSAIIPGLGKIYAGKTKQGLVSFFPVVLLGLQAYEVFASKKGGLKSPWFIANAGLFAVFYVGNIWGSALSVSVKRKELQHEVNDQILLNLRIPLQKLYK
jgi:hypothetical protein